MKANSCLKISCDLIFAFEYFSALKLVKFNEDKFCYKDLNNEPTSKN
jgi:hypothetical protein